MAASHDLARGPQVVETVCPLPAIVEKFKRGRDLPELSEESDCARRQSLDDATLVAEPFGNRDRACVRRKCFL